MVYSECLAKQIRTIISQKLAPQIVEEELEEKKMFGGLAFMVRGKMAVTVNQTKGQDKVMVRIGKDREEQLLPRKGVSVTLMRGRLYHGYLDLAPEVFPDLDFWVDQALQFNQELTQLDQK